MINWNDKHKIESTVLNSRNLKESLVNLGLKTYYDNFVRLKKAILTLDISTSHFTRINKIPDSWNDEIKLITAINNSTSLKEVLNYMGMDNTGSNYIALHKHVKRLNINISHLAQGKTKHSKIFSIKLVLSDILVANSPYKGGTSHLKKRLLQAGLLEYRCVKCGNDGNWCNEKLVLQLDHINGTRSDNRLENLRILCPNCHTQTVTFAGKKHPLAGTKTDKRKYGSWETYLYCIKQKPNQRKVPRPSKEELNKLLWEMPTARIAKMYNMSDNGIARWVKDYGLQKPSRGYWTKKHAGKI